MFKAETREKIIKTEEKVITVDKSIMDFCDWLYSEFGKQGMSDIITGIRAGYKQLTLCEPADECWEDDYEELFINYTEE